MKKIGLTLICTVLIFSSCVKELVRPVSNEARVSFQLKTKDVKEVETKSNVHENDMNDIYLIVFDGVTDLFVECQPATKITDNSYMAPLTPRASTVKIVAVANVKSLVEANMSGWIAGTTTYNKVSEDLLTDELTSNGGAIVSMPEIPPMSSMLILDKIEKVMNITAPFVMERATAKITISVSAANFTLLGANLYNAPTKGYVMQNQSTTNLLAIIRGNYAGTDGSGGYGAEHMICTATQNNPLYCYETPIHTDEAKHPYVIINSNRGYYRINFTNKIGDQLNLQRNYYYKINITKVVNNGALTPEEAEKNPPINADVVINDPTSHEIISNGVDYLGLTNSEYIIYDSYVLNEFNASGTNSTYGSDYETINGYDVTTLTYKSRDACEVTCVECVTASGVGTIRFQNSSIGVWDSPTTIEENFGWNNITDKITLPASEKITISKKIIINIPHDFQRGKIKVKVGELEREIRIERNQIISYMGDALDMGTGFSTAKIDFEMDFDARSYFLMERPPYGFEVPSTFKGSTSDVINFSTSSLGTYTKSLIMNPSEHLYVKINPIGGDKNSMYTSYPMYSSRISEFYLTRDANQSRVKVHLIQEPFRDSAKDAQGCGSSLENYCAAFWKNNESGERIIRVPSLRESYFWTARVIYGEDFIRLALTDSRTQGTGRSAVTSGDPEDAQPDATWKTYLEPPFSKSDVAFPQFRIGLTEKNPNPLKPRYGLVAFMVPYSTGSGSGNGQTFLILVRQGEEPDYIFSPTDTYEGSLRTFAQPFSPYNLTVSDPGNHLGGPNYSNHKSMNGRGVFAKYPTQQGYLYQWGNDVAIHPTNPAPYTAISGYTYDYNAMYKEVCPDGYTLPKTDALNSAKLHSFVDPIVKRGNSGLCADGFFDRKAYTSNTLVGDGGEQSHNGYVFYNTKTLANIFIPEAQIRTGTDGKSDLSAALYWANIISETGNTQGALNVNLFGTTQSVFDRQSAFPIRCVKKENP